MWDKKCHKWFVYKAGGTWVWDKKYHKWFVSRQVGARLEASQVVCLEGRWDMGVGQEVSQVICFKAGGTWVWDKKYHEWFVSRQVGHGCRTRSITSGLLTRQVGNGCGTRSVTSGLLTRQVGHGSGTRSIMSGLCLQTLMSVVRTGESVSTSVSISTEATSAHVGQATGSSANPSAKVCPFPLLPQRCVSHVSYLVY